MNQSDQPESCFIGIPEIDCQIGLLMRDVEVVRVTKTNVIARGRRYGRQWFLKGLRGELKDSAVMQRQLQKEFEIHSRLRHPAVPQLVGLENIEGLGLCIVQEWIEGVTLQEILEREKPGSAEKRRIMHDLVETVAYLHSRGIVHRDLKPANVMIRDIGKEVVLIDYGLADTSDYVEIKGPAGTPGFISPEQIDSGGANPTDDVYSLGVIMRAFSSGFNRIAKKCTGPLKSRPKDAGALLELIDSRAKRPRIIMYLIVALLILIIAVLTVNRIRSLENSSQAASERVGKISDENARNAALVSSLEDSLTNVTGNLLQAREELEKQTKYEEQKQLAVKKGCQLLDNILLKQDKIFADNSGPKSEEYAEIINQLFLNSGQTIKDYCSSLEKAGLTQEDIEIIHSTLYFYFSKQFSDYQKEWMKEMNYVQKEKK